MTLFVWSLVVRTVIGTKGPRRSLVVLDSLPVKLCFEPPTKTSTPEVSVGPNGFELH